VIIWVMTSKTSFPLESVGNKPIPESEDDIPVSLTALFVPEKLKLIHSQVCLLPQSRIESLLINRFLEGDGEVDYQEPLTGPVDCSHSLLMAS